MERKRAPRPNLENSKSDLDSPDAYRGPSRVKQKRLGRRAMDAVMNETMDLTNGLNIDWSRVPRVFKRLSEFQADQRITYKPSNYYLVTLIRIWRANRKIRRQALQFHSAGTLRVLEAIERQQGRFFVIQGIGKDGKVKLIRQPEHPYPKREDFRK